MSINKNYIKIQPHSYTPSSPSIMSLDSLTSDFDTILNWSSSNVKKYEVIETTEDLLALSCTWHRIRTLNLPARSTIDRMLSDELFELVTDADREMANEVRDYYSKKLMIFTLKDQKLTPFRQDLSEYLHGDANKFTEKAIAMVYRLPEFYVVDAEFDKVKQDLDKELPNFNLSDRRAVKRQVTLTPITFFNKNTKTTKLVEYWLKDKNDNAYQLIIQDPANNKLLSLWNREFKQTQITLDTDLFPAIRDDLQFYRIMKFAVI